MYKTQQETFISVPESSFADRVNELINSTLSRKYWQPTLDSYNRKVDSLIKSGISEKNASIVVLDQLTSILRDSEPKVMELIEKSGKDVKQSRVSVAGNNFQALVRHALLKNVLLNNLPELNIVLKPKRHPIVKEYCTIKVGDELQKPDLDILIFEDNEEGPLVICSCKTSLRERAGQTYKWKLLLDLATTDPKHLADNPDCPINKYKIEYDSKRQIYTIIITADLYKEVNRPQQRGLFTFFDNAFVTQKREGLSNHVNSMSSIVKYLNKVYRT